MRSDNVSLRTIAGALALIVAVAVAVALLTADRSEPTAATPPVAGVRTLDDPAPQDLGDLPAATVPRRHARSTPTPAPNVTAAPTTQAIPAPTSAPTSAPQQSGETLEDGGSGSG